MDAFPNAQSLFAVRNEIPSVCDRSTPRRRIYLGRVDRPAERAGEPLFYADSGAVYVPLAGSDEGDLFYFSNDRVDVRRFDPAKLTASATAGAIDLLTGEHALTNPRTLGNTVRHLPGWQPDLLHAS